MRVKQTIRDNVFEGLSKLSRPMLHRAIKRAAESGYRPFVIPFKPGDVEKLLQFLEAAEEIPTVAEGMRTLGMRSLAEWLWKKDEICLRRSPYTHDTLKPYIFLPGLRARMFFDRNEFSWVDRLEDNFETIREEVRHVLEEKVGFQPYRIAESDRVDERWNLMVFRLGEHWVEENASLCPTLVKTVESIPGQSPLGYMMLSALNPGHTIDPHYGLMNGILRVHLGLFGCDQDCFLRVGTQIRKWENGRALIFDDNFEHQVCHNGDRIRVVLWIDVWHPDWPDQDARRFEDLLRRYFLQMEWYQDQERDRKARLQESRTPDLAPVGPTS